MNIVGHQKILKFLQKSVANNQLAHAYLFYGPEHIGKSRVADFFIANLFCQKKVKNSFSPCGKCSSCHQLLKKIHPDFICLDNSSSLEKIGIEQIRQLKEFLFSSPFSVSHKAVIIKQADNLTISAANALLKFLEEPPAKTIIILIARGFAHFPATVRSRCQILRFSFPLKNEIIDFLKKDFSLKDKQAKDVLNLAIGRPGLAIQFAQDIEKIKQQRELTENFIALLNKGDLESKFHIADLIQTAGKSPQNALNNLARLFRDLILIKLNLCPSDELIFVQLKKLAQKYSQKDLRDLISQIFKTQYLLSANVNQKLAIENLTIN